MEDVWKEHWAATPNPRNLGFHEANLIPPPLNQLDGLNRKTFSRLIPFRTGPAHISKYYHRFGIHSESRECPCGAANQTREHILQVCPLHKRFRHILGHRRQCRYDILMGKPKGILRLADFIKKSRVTNKHSAQNDTRTTEASRAPGGWD
jgi:hypothetical protein